MYFYEYDDEIEINPILTLISHHVVCYLQVEKVKEFEATKAAKWSRNTYSTFQKIAYTSGVCYKKNE